MCILGCKPDYFYLKENCGNLHKLVKEVADEFGFDGYI